MEIWQRYIVLISLVIGDNLYFIAQVESVPLEEIRKASLLAEKLLCDKLDWHAGIEAAQACQVKITPPNFDRDVKQLCRRSLTSTLCPPPSTSTPARSQSGELSG